MKKKLAWILAFSLSLSVPFPVHADEKDDKIQELEAQIAQLQSKVDELQAIIDSYSPTTQDSYAMGETWVVDGQWKLTVNSVEEVSERNEFSDKDPAAVYIVDYVYENLGYEEEGWDGLFLSIDDGIVDAAGEMGYSYPGEITNYPQETPVGAKCSAQVCIGVNNPGSFKIHFSTYDANSENQKAVFDIAVE